MTFTSERLLSSSGATVSPLEGRTWPRWLRSARRWLIAVAALLVVALSAWVLFFSHWLAADQVVVSGTHTLTVNDVTAAADVPLGTPLTRVDMDAIRARVASLPAVDSVTVHRSWPSTISIEVAERQPVAVSRRGDSWWTFDTEGVLFRRVPRTDDGLPVVSVRGPDAQSLRAETAQVLAVLPAALLDTVQRVSATSMDSVRLHLVHGRLVEWGSSADSERKAQVLSLLMQRAKATAYDVSVPAQPTSSDRA